MEPTLILELVGLFLTLMILLYMIIGDNPLFRIVSYTFVGVASGYVTVLLVFQVLFPRLFNVLNTGNLLLLIPFVLGLLLVFKLSSRFSAFGTLPLAILVGVGAAVAVGGAVFGTLFGQVRGTIGGLRLEGVESPLAQLLEGAFILLGTVATLAYFQFGTRGRPAASLEPAEQPGSAAPAAAETPAPESGAAARRAVAMEMLAKIGQIFIGITLGAMFAGVYAAAITALIERLGFVIDVVNRTMGRFF